jgi:outer membrane protein assembly factor BamB
MTGPAGGRPRHRRAPAALVVAAAAVLAACGTETEPPVTPRVPVRLVLTAADTITVTGGTLTFAAVAVDSLDAPVATDPVTWSVTNPGRGTVTPTGGFTGGPLIGGLYVRARLAEPPLAESVAVRVVPPGTVKWTWAATQIGTNLPTIGGPALGAEGSVYVLVETSEYPDWGAALVALSPLGVVRWTRQLQQVSANYPVVAPRGEILVVGQSVHLFSPDGTLQWDVVTDALVPQFKAGAATDELAIAAHGYHVTAFRLTTGDTVWQSQLAPFSSWLVPPTAVGRNLVYIKRTSDTLFAFRQSDGTILRTWLDPDTGVDKRVWGRGTVPVGERFYLPTWNRLAAFDTAGPLLWLTPSEERTNYGMPEPAVGPDGVLYVQSARLGLEAINPDGSLRWYRRRNLAIGGLWEAPRWPWYGGAALAEGGIIYVAGKGAFSAYDTAGTLRWEHAVDSAGVPQPFLGAPAIAPDGTVYSYTSTHVYAFWASARPEPNSPWPMWRHDAQRTGWVR